MVDLVVREYKGKEITICKRTHHHPETRYRVYIDGYRFSSKTMNTFADKGSALRTVIKYIDMGWKP